MSPQYLQEVIGSLDIDLIGEVRILIRSRRDDRSKVDDVVHSRASLHECLRLGDVSIEGLNVPLQLIEEIAILRGGEVKGSHLHIGAEAHKAPKYPGANGPTGTGDEDSLVWTTGVISLIHNLIFYIRYR